jgi:hypothetical protein
VSPGQLGGDNCGTPIPGCRGRLSGIHSGVPATVAYRIAAVPELKLNFRRGTWINGLTGSVECESFLIATESTEGHGKVAGRYYSLPCFSVDSVAIMCVFVKLKKLHEPVGC